MDSIETFQPLLVAIIIGVAVIAAALVLGAPLRQLAAAQERRNEIDEQARAEDIERVRADISAETSAEIKQGDDAVREEVLDDVDKLGEAVGAVRIAGSGWWLGEDGLRGRVPAGVGLARPEDYPPDQQDHTGQLVPANQQPRQLPPLHELLGVADTRPEAIAATDETRQAVWNWMLRWMRDSDAPQGAMPWEYHPNDQYTWYEHIRAWLVHNYDGYSLPANIEHLFPPLANHGPYRAWLDQNPPQ